MRAVHLVACAGKVVVKEVGLPLLRRLFVANRCC